MSKKGLHTFDSKLLIVKIQEGKHWQIKKLPNFSSHLPLYFPYPLTDTDACNKKKKAKMSSFSYHLSTEYRMKAPINIVASKNPPFCVVFSTFLIYHLFPRPFSFSFFISSVPVQLKKKNPRKSNATSTQ